MFNNCSKLKEIKGINNFKTNQVMNMKQCLMDAMN